jgi:two-component system OmpR family sensor kinase
VVIFPSTTNPSGPLTTPTDKWLAELPRVDQWRSVPPATTATFTAQTPQGTYRVQGGPLVVGGQRVGTYAAASSLDALNTDRQEQLALAALEGLLALIAAIGAGFLLLRRALRTVNKVTEAANEATQGDLSKRLSYQGPDDEVGRLARTVDAMLTQLDASFTAQRRLLADVSHQLRTPLTVARGHLEVLARQHPDLDGDQAETVAVVVDELTQMSLMVDRLLMLGQALEPDFLLEERIELPALLHEVVDAAQVMAPRNWVMEPVPEVVIWADRAKLRGALLNLVDNAVKATSEKGTIRLAAEVGPELLLAVSDDGRGISEEDQRQVFDRFRRFAQSSYGGSGLGLAIVKAVVEAHGGHAHLTSAVGQGCKVVIALPASRIRPELDSQVQKAGVR